MCRAEYEVAIVMEKKGYDYNWDRDQKKVKMKKKKEGKKEKKRGKENWEDEKKTHILSLKDNLSTQYCDAKNA